MATVSKVLAILAAGNFACSLWMLVFGGYTIHDYPLYPACGAPVAAILLLIASGIAASRDRGRAESSIQ